MKMIKKSELKEYTEKVFEDIKHTDENGNDYWLARELMKVLEYKEWRKFNKVIKIIALAQTYFAIQARNLV